MENQKGGNSVDPWEGMFEEDLYDTLPDLFYVIDREWQSRRWNDQLLKQTGYTDEEIAELHPLKFIPEEERETMVRHVRAVFEHGETRTYESSLLTKDGERIPYEFNGSPVTDESGTVVGLAGTGRNISERKKRERELQQYETLFETIDDGVYVIDSDLRFAAVNEAFATMTGYDRDQLIGSHVSLVTTEDGFGRASELAIEIADGKRDVAVLESEVVRHDETVLPTETRFTVLPDDTTSFVGVVRDVSDRRERERELRQQRDELETLNRINALIRELLRALASTATRDEVERTVCAHLADSDLYRSASIGERDRETGGIARRTHAGTDDGIWKLIERGTEENDWDRPASDVLRTGTLDVVANISTDSRYPESVRDALSATTVQSRIAVPLSYGQTTYGVLVVYATRPDAFTEREAAGFEALGELVGFAINATESKKLLTTDAVVELEFHVTDDDAVMVDLSRRTDCRLVLDGTVPTSDGRYLYYVRVEGTQPKQVAESARTLSTVYDAQVISTHNEGGLLLLTVSSSLVELFVEAGAKVLTAQAQDGVEHVVVEVAQDTDIRTLVGSIQSSYHGIELVAKRDAGRTDDTETEFQDVLATDLTNRQQAAFRAAYLAGYYDWPRDSTAEEVADTMGIAPATLHQHLRKAEGKLASAFFDDVTS
ncbi:bacterio-opsin activator domain-containing protein [Haladaptatus sp. NG-SE-30]